MKFILDACEPTVASNISKHDPPTSDRKKVARSLAGPTSFGKSPTGAVCEIGNCIASEYPETATASTSKPSSTVQLLSHCCLRGEQRYLLHGILHLFSRFAGPKSSRQLTLVQLTPPNRSPHGLGS